MEPTTAIGERIKHIREGRNYTQQFLASKLNISQKAYSKIEAGEIRLTVENLLKIAEVLETSINNILETDGSAVYNNFSTHNGEGIVIHKTGTEKLHELYEKIIASKDEEIKRIVQQNETFLRTIESVASKK